jgi:hypothetical protein
MCRGIVVSFAQEPLKKGKGCVEVLLYPTRCDILFANHADGVAITHLDRVFSVHGLRVRDVISHFNDIPITTHQQAATTIETARQNRMSIRFRVKSSMRWRFHGLRSCLTPVVSVDPVD